jgi:hypothetical protein
MHTSRAENQKPQKAKAVPPQHVLDDTKLFVGTVLAFTLKKNNFQPYFGDLGVH